MNPEPARPLVRLLRLVLSRAAADEILGRTRTKRHVRRKGEYRRSLHNGFLVGQRAKGDVETDTGRRAEQQDTIGSSELRGVVDPRVEVSNQSRDERGFVLKAGQQSQVDVNCLTRLAPSLEGEAADEAVAPPFGFADLLEIGRRSDDSVHGYSVRNQRCCSTSPEVGFGALDGSK